MAIDPRGNGYWPISLVDPATGNPAVLGFTSSITASDANGTLAAATAAQLLPASAARQALFISNTGANPMQIRFGANPTAAIGHTIAPGGSFTFDAKCPSAALFGFSTTGTTWFATVGV